MEDDRPSMFRSETMVLTQLYIPLEIAAQTVAELGEVGQLEINDVLRFLKKQAEKAEVRLRPAEPLAPYARNRSQLEIDQLDATLIELEGRILQMNTSQESLNKRFLELTELRHVLRETAAESRSDEMNAAHAENVGLLAGMQRESIEPAASTGQVINIGFVAGVIPRARMGIFEKILFRALRGNLFMNNAEIAEPIVDPTSDATVYKNVFIVFAHGKELLNKIRKICESMGATLYPVDDHPDKRRDNALEVMTRIEDLRHVLDNTKAARKAELSRVADSLDHWSVVVTKEKAIHHAMNKMSYDLNRKALIAEGWCPKASITAIQYSLRTVTERTGSTIPPILSEIPTSRTPPTSQKTNRYTNSFQELVDAYGIAKYQEVNPGLYTIISFPFFFAVMFGDFGHGIILTAIAGWMVANEKTLSKKKWGEMFDMPFGGRYMMLLMGIFSIFTGLIYNDIFSRAMTLMDSCYKFTFHPESGRWLGTKTETYGFGVDPGWHGAENALIFSNSYKMKMAIIFGVIHMSFGITLQCFNHIHFKKRLSILTEYVPQILFFLSIFGYLVFLIIYKWLTHYPDPSKAPGLLNTLIYMFLSPGTVVMPLFKGQGPIQVFLLLVAFVSVPWMLLAKPYYELQEHKRTTGAGYTRPQAADQQAILAEQGAPAHVETHGDHGEHGEEFDFGEAMIHQMIHTIEFTLSGISNTASYLRLWALSLAHAQLSEVLWDMMLNPALNSGNAIVIIIGFYMWFWSTVGILIGMEGLSAFLHALRLHWVEFQNKFYAGSGQQFFPFSFKLLIENQEN
ncbi:H(+)-transporting V0 sector ATPase subunit a [Globomyces sp. JEL0801]|nr:H(+)-transporting V0 sector ATPase subunit a [Globomyces sp. JEL0801]